MEKLLGEFSVGLFFWQTLLFVALILLLKKFAWKPILDAVNEREQGIKDALDSAEQAKQEMANLQADNEKLLKEARDIKNKMIIDAKEEAKGEADKMVAQAQAAIESEKKAAIADLKNQVASLSLEIAEKVVRENLSSDDKQQKLVKNLLDDSSLN